MDIKDLESMIAKTGDLPAMPSIAVKVMEMVSDPNTSANDLQQLISRDQALTTKVLKIANSAMFGVSRDISTLSHAIMILGFSTIRSIVLAASTKSIYMKGGSDAGFSSKLLWDEAVGCAMFARYITQYIKGVNEEEAFIAGLLHNIGKTVIIMNFSSAYEEVIREVYNNGSNLIETEHEKMGFDHSQVGSLVLRKWNLSRSLEDAVLYYHSPENSEVDKELTAAVGLAHLYCNLIGLGPEASEEVDVKSFSGSSILKLDENDLQTIEQNLNDTYENEKSLFEL
jgi:HD-like signal output (HDOD) protein